MSDPFESNPMLVGKVLRAHSQGTGFVLDCKPEDWINKSKLHNRRQDIPPVGLHVEVPFELYNDRMYMIDWRPVETSYELTDEQVAARVSLRAGELHDDKPVVTRLACLNAAIAYRNGIGPYSEVADILYTAEEFVAWAKGASIPDALAVLSPSEPPEEESEATGSPESSPTGSDESKNTPAGSPTARKASSSSPVPIRS